jgi:hypothetical protein
VKIALYKGTRPGLAALFSIGTRLWTRGDYSHCELVFDDGVSYSSSFVDHGVRGKLIVFNPEHWDFVDLGADCPVARSWFTERLGQQYDLLGLLGFLWGPTRDCTDKWFCSEAVASALGISEGWRINPNALATIFRGRYGKHDPQ